MKHITVEANIDNLDKIMDFVNAELELKGFPADSVPDIDVAVEEIFLNISSYAYEPAENPPKDGRLGLLSQAPSGDVTLFVNVGEEAMLQFVDTGKPFNPLEAPAPDLDKPLMERDIGGLGIAFVKQLMDDVTYTYVGAQNMLTIIKRR